MPRRTHDVFISHAWEDIDAVARPIAEKLRRLGIRVWFDEFSLRVGDSLRQSIDRGLANTRFGVVVLSPRFFAKQWTQYELNGLVERQTLRGRRVVLPIWHEVTARDVKRYSPPLADLVALRTSQGIDIVVERIAEVVGPHHRKVNQMEQIPPVVGREGPLEILLVEENVQEAESVAKALAVSGYHVRTAGTGRIARSLIEQVEPDLILLDLDLPDTDGLVLTTTFKVLTNAPIIICTARQEQVDRVLGLKLGADDFVPKPFEIYELEARIEAVLRRWHGARPRVRTTTWTSDAQ